MGEPLLSVTDLKVAVLEPVSFSMAAGECLALRGPSGSGKSLLLRAIADLDPAPGQVFVRGRERGLCSGPEWRREVRYAAAEPGWWDEMPRPHFDAAARIDERVWDLGLGRDVLDRPIARLSTGERQRLALLRSVQDDPAILLLDEPTGALDADATHLAEGLMLRLLGRGKAIILVSHDDAQAARMARRRLVIRSGAVTSEIA